MIIYLKNKNKIYSIQRYLVLKYINLLKNKLSIKLKKNGLNKKNNNLFDYFKLLMNKMYLKLLFILKNFLIEIVLKNTLDFNVLLLNGDQIKILN